MQIAEEDAGEESEKASGHIIQHDAGADRQAFELADRPWLPDVEEAKEQQIERRMTPVRGLSLIHI